MQLFGRIFFHFAFCELMETFGCNSFIISVSLFVYFSENLVDQLYLQPSVSYNSLIFLCVCGCEIIVCMIMLTFQHAFVLQCYSVYLKYYIFRSLLSFFVWILQCMRHSYLLHYKRGRTEHCGLVFAEFWWSHFVTVHVDVSSPMYRVHMIVWFPFWPKNIVYYRPTSCFTSDWKHRTPCLDQLWLSA